MKLPRPWRGGARGAGTSAGADEDEAPPRRTWPQRLLIAFNTWLVMVCFVAAWGLSRAEQEYAAIPKVPLRGVLDAHDDPTAPVNFLLIGSDHTDDPARAHYLADSISILRVDPEGSRISLLSLPRDVWVKTPGRTRTIKLTEALSYADAPGDPELLIRIIQDQFELPVHYYLQVDFAAFEALVDQLEGVQIWFDRPARDAGSGLLIEDSGCLSLNGRDALAYARARSYQERDEDGEWGDFDPSGDIGRIARQQYGLKPAAKKAIARGARNPVVLADLLGVAQRYLKIDDTLPPKVLLDLAGHFDAFNPEDLEAFQPYTEPQTRRRVGGAGQRLLRDLSEPIFERFRDRVDDGGGDRDAGDGSPAGDPTNAGTRRSEGTVPGSSVPTGPSATDPEGLAATATTAPAPDAYAFLPDPPPGVAC